MKKIWRALRLLYDWIRSVHQEGTPDSSKKLYGGLAFMGVAIKILLSQPELTQSLLLVCVGMLGWEGVSNIFNKR